jgi:ribosomal protein S8
MIAVMRNSIKTHKKNCSVPGNKFCFQALSLMRSQGLILGFHLDITERKKIWQGYPRYNILLKYKNFNEPIIKKIKLYKNTKSNFYFFNVNRKILDPLKKKRLYLINSKKGLQMLSVENFLMLYKKKKFKGKLILELNI